MLFCIDIGTAGGKAALFSDDLEMLALCRRDYPTHLDGAGVRAEQNPEDWWRLLCESVPDLLARTGADAREIRAVGISCMTPVLLPVDGDGAPLARAQVWYDRRAAALAPELNRAMGPGGFERITGSACKGISFLPKLLYFRDTQPALYARTCAFLQVNGYLVRRLTGVTSMDSSHGELTLLVDKDTGAYSREIAEAFRLDPDKLPPIVPADGVAGRVSAEAARLTGLPEGIPVISGGHDSALSAYALGVDSPGDACLDIGNAANLILCVERAVSCPAADVYRHPVDGKWLFQIYSATVGASLRWYRNLFDWQSAFGPGADTCSPYDLLCEGAARSPAGANGALFLPYLQGAQQCDAVSGSFRNLRLCSGRDDLTRALLEGCAMSVRYNMEQMEAASAMRMREIIVSGGGSRSPIWMQIFADILEKPLRASPLSEAALTGAAMLAGRALGRPPRAAQPRSAAIPPDGRNRGAYREAYGRFVQAFERDMLDYAQRGPQTS